MRNYKLVVGLYIIFIIIHKLYSENINLPELISPAKEEIINTITPKFKWQKVENADYYNIAIYLDYSCTNKLLESKPYPKSTKWKVPKNYLQDGKMYYWRISAHNINGWTKPSEVRIFTVMMKTNLNSKKDKINLAVAEFSGKNVSQADASIIADFLRTEFVSAGLYNVVEKANMDKILAEASFQQSGCTTSECAVQIGKILNVQKMIVGVLSKLEGVYHITASIVDVETGKIENSKNVQCQEASELVNASSDLVGILTGTRGQDRKSIKYEKSSNNKFGIGLGNPYISLILNLSKRFIFEPRYARSFEEDWNIYLSGGRIYYNIVLDNKMILYVAGEWYYITYNGPIKENSLQSDEGKGTMPGLYFGIVYNISKKLAINIDAGSSYINLNKGDVDGFEWIANTGIRFYLF